MLTGGWTRSLQWLLHRQSHFHPTSAIVALSLGAGACNAGTEPGADTSVVSALAYFGDTGAIIAPDTIKQDSSFSVSIETFWSGCHTPDTVNVTTNGSVAVLTPYDDYSAGHACTDELDEGSRVVEVHFAQAGPAEVQVRGANAIMGPGTPVTWVVLTDSLTVLP